MTKKVFIIKRGYFHVNLYAQHDFFYQDTMIIIFLEFAAQLKYTRAKAKIASGQGFF